MSYYEYTKRAVKVKTRKIKINPCKKCKSTDINVHNCDYTTFNIGSIQCKKCKAAITINHLPWSTDGELVLVKEWNYQNSKKYIRDQISTHKKAIKKLEKELAKMG